MEQHHEVVETTLPTPLHHAWSHGIPSVATIYPPCRHPEWTAKVAGPYFETPQAHGVKRIFMPNFSRPSYRIAEPRIFHEKRVVLERTMEVWSNPGYVCGGAGFIQRGEGVAVPTGGCINIVLTVTPPNRSPFCVYLHGHRDMLIDQIDVKFGKPTTDRQPNIIERSLQMLFAEYYIGPECVSLLGFGNLSPQDFPHDPKDERIPVYQDVNAKRYDYLTKLLPKADIDKILPRHDDRICLDTGELVKAFA
ncbi:MAG: hypothetical protein P4M11_07290 [Candidatus Pacebacteria bacterium]|nr:hypothetical protein [Candidatus Paceibacterota bacterium]